MQFTATLLSLVSVASAIRVSYDTGYDQSDRSLNTVSCSDGDNGLVSRYPANGNLPNFPLIGGASVISGWGSASCGTCWALTWNGAFINVIAMDHANEGFNIAKGALDILTGGRAVELGAIDAQYWQVDKSVCGL